MSDRPKAKERSITIWASEELLDQIDQHLAQLAVQHCPRQVLPARVAPVPGAARAGQPPRPACRGRSAG